MNLQKLLSQREGKRNVAFVLIERINNIKLQIKPDAESLIEFDATLESLEDIFNTIKVLDEKIQKETDDERISEEILSATQFSLDTDIQLRKLRAFRKSERQRPAESSFQQDESEPETISSPTDPENQRATEIISAPTGLTNQHTSERCNPLPGDGPLARCSTEPLLAVNSQSQTVSHVYSNSSNSSQFHRLPKITLPTFSGDILYWQTFWDSFESTVHNNVHLTDVQKFTYLKAQLECEAASTIEGFALTNANYISAIELLKERYGQVHKITHAIMQALLQIPPPVYHVQSVRQFCDKMEGYIRGLESLGQFQETYGSLLVPIILEKLPVEMKKNLAREHGDCNWMLAELRQALKIELTIMQASGVPYMQPEIQQFENSASFLAGAKTGKKQKTFARTDVTQKRHSCAFCKNDHATPECKMFRDTDSRINVIKKERLCYNCLGKHQVANCRSNNRCQKCKRKHHTSICRAHEESSRSNNQQETTVLYSSDRHVHTDVLLKTALGTVSYENTSSQAIVLFDEGAQKSFITEKLANELGVQRQGRETVQLSAFGGDRNHIQNFDTATVFIVTKSRQKTGACAYNTKDSLSTVHSSEYCCKEIFVP